VRYAVHRQFRFGSNGFARGRIWKAREFAGRCAARPPTAFGLGNRFDGSTGGPIQDFPGKTFKEEQRREMVAGATWSGRTGITHAHFCAP